MKLGSGTGSLVNHLMSTRSNDEPMSGKDISRKKMLNELKQFVKDNPKLVRMNKTSNPNLFVLKYARSVFYNNAWNEFLENCRGTIVDDEFNIVSLPFTKIYNFGI